MRITGLVTTSTMAGDLSGRGLDGDRLALHHGEARRAAATWRLKQWTPLAADKPLQVSLSPSWHLTGLMKSVCARFICSVNKQPSRQTEPVPLCDNTRVPQHQRIARCGMEYQAIENYAAIGNMKSLALVRQRGLD